MFVYEFVSISFEYEPCIKASIPNILQIWKNKKGEDADEKSFPLVLKIAIG